MNIHLSVRENTSVPSWYDERFVGRGIHGDKVTSSNRLRLINHLKGTALMVVGEFEKVPDLISFSIFERSSHWFRRVSLRFIRRRFGIYQYQCLVCGTLAHEMPGEKKRCLYGR